MLASCWVLDARLTSKWRSYVSAVTQSGLICSLFCPLQPCLRGLICSLFCPLQPCLRGLMCSLFCPLQPCLRGLICSLFCPLQPCLRGLICSLFCPLQPCLRGLICSLFCPLQRSIFSTLNSSILLATLCRFGPLWCLLGAHWRLYGPLLAHFGVSWPYFFRCVKQGCLTHLTRCVFMMPNGGHKGHILTNLPRFGDLLLIFSVTLLR